MNKRIKILLASVPLAGIALGVAACGPSSTVVRTVVVQPSAAPKATTEKAKAAPAQKPSAAPAPKPQVVARFNGSGIENTPTFFTGSDWHLSWWYGCSNFGGSGNFMVQGYSPDGQPDLNGVEVNELGAGEGPVATYVYGDAGTHYLQINSECDWSVAVVTG